ncbi:hypothetical protein L6475_00190 [Prevotella sp. E9-3]|uniref:hypothetical protein n=1 Tax=Prevotella sp. E9-3 TaxID=2913621 RepID=UPI001EDA99F6|nr:hypothetical protein [Prevotella sp. E9-3]UKK48421.1 hypothetical protein L6475_00190 [Prevotella sp. E9-3]
MARFHSTLVNSFYKSDISLTLVLQFKTSKIINDMAKIQLKSEKVTPFGGIFHVRELFSRYMDPIINKVLGLQQRQKI